MKTLTNRSFSFITKIILTITIIFTVLMISCAEVAPPPGGEEDKSKPLLISSDPPNGMVNVPLGNVITLYFSENILPATGRSVFISPRPIEEPKIKWKKEKIEIFFSDSFKVNETYIISLSSGIKDLRNNTLDSTGIIAFSTGPTLDTGIVRGTLFQNSKPRGGLFVALYDEQILSDSVTYDSLYPTYFTQTNSEGIFSFEYLPSKNFRLIAFEDKNKDEYFNPLRESFAVTDRPVQVGGAINLEDLSLSMTTQDTTKLGILSASLTTDNLLKIRFSKPIDIKAIAKNPELVILNSVDDSSKLFKCKSLLEEPDIPIANIILYHGILDEGNYNINLTYDSTKPSLKYEGVTVTKVEDKTPPSIISFQPEKSPVLLEDLDIQLKFSELLKRDAITNSTFIISTGDDTLQTALSEWIDDFRLKINNPDFNAGKSYKLVVTEFELMDQAGQVVGDSLSDYSFSTIDSNSLGSISGEVRISIPIKEDAPVILTLTNISKKTEYKLHVTDKTFNIDVLSGSYLLSAHVDSNNDDEFDNGSVNPHRYAETLANYPDTIKVRARFETTGIIFDIK